MLLYSRYWEGPGGLQEEEEDEGRGGDSRRAEEDGNTREVRRSDGRGWRGVEGRSMQLQLLLSMSCRGPIENRKSHTHTHTCTDAHVRRHTRWRLCCFSARSGSERSRRTTKRSRRDPKIISLSSKTASRCRFHFTSARLFPIKVICLDPKTR